MPKPMSVEAAADAIRDQIADRSSALEPWDRHMQNFAIDVAQKLELEPTPDVVSEVRGLLERSDIVPEGVTEFPKMLTEVSKGKAVPVFDRNGQPIIFQNAEEEAQFTDPKSWPPEEGVEQPVAETPSTEEPVDTGRRSRQRQRA